MIVGQAWLRDETPQVIESSLVKDSSAMFDLPFCLLANYIRSSLHPTDTAQPPETPMNNNGTSGRNSFAKIDFFSHHHIDF